MTFIFPQVFNFAHIPSFATSFALTIHFAPKQSVNYGVSRTKAFLAAGYKNLQMAVQPWAIRFVDPHKTHWHSGVETGICYLCKDAQISFTSLVVRKRPGNGKKEPAWLLFCSAFLSRVLLVLHFGIEDKESVRCSDKPKG